MTKIWANSADSHVLEPDDLWTSSLPADLAERAPRADVDGDRFTTLVDGRIVRRDPLAFHEAMRPPGAHDFTIRLRDLDEQGVWAEVAFPSQGLWTTIMTDPRLVRECCRAYNDWCLPAMAAVSDRFIPTAVVSMLDTTDAVSEFERAVGLGYRAVFLSATPPADRPYNDEVWEPLWAVAAEAGTPLCFHVGTGAEQKVSRGAGAAVINYVETFFPAQRTVAHLVASGALDRHPTLRAFMAEGGASWVPALADRMDESYRQHGMFVRPELSMLPSELIFRQVYASFQHDRSAVPAYTAMGYHNVMWGSDYPHLEGTFPDTQRVLHELFDDVPAAAREAMTLTTLAELFGVPLPVFA